MSSDNASLDNGDPDTVAIFEVAGHDLIGKFVRDEVAAKGGLKLWQEVMLRIPANQLSDLASKFSQIQSAQTNGTDLDASTMGAFFEGLKEISELNNPGKGVLVETAVGLNFRFRRYAFSVNNFTSIGADPNVDLINIGLGC